MQERPVGLGAVERKIGAAHQIVRRDAVIGGDRDADADPEHGLGAGDRERLGHRADDAARQRRRLVERGDLWPHDGELVAADAGDQRAFRNIR